MSDKQLILAFFADQPAAETAALALKDSGAADNDGLFARSGGLRRVTGWGVFPR